MKTVYSYPSSTGNSRDIIIHRIKPLGLSSWNNKTQTYYKVTYTLTSAEPINRGSLIYYSINEYKCIERGWQEVCAKRGTLIWPLPKGYIKKLAA